MGGIRPQTIPITCVCGHKHRLNMVGMTVVINAFLRNEGHTMTGNGIEPRCVVELIKESGNEIARVY